jgi:hypothetical protein
VPFAESEQQGVPIHGVNIGVHAQDANSRSNEQYASLIVSAMFIVPGVVLVIAGGRKIIAR